MGAIISISSIRDIFNHATQEDFARAATCVDLDRTTLDQKEGEFSLCELKDWLKDGVKKGVLERGVAKEVQYWAFQRVPAQPVEGDTTIDTLKRVQSTSQTYIALTARVFKTEGRTTQKHLEQIGMGDVRTVFTDAQPKGPAFAALRETDARIKECALVILIDDTRDHLESMQATCATLGIEFMGFHYTGCRVVKDDEHVKTFLKGHGLMDPKTEELLPPPAVAHTE